MRQRIATVLTGAVVGGLLWSALDELGVWSVIKSDPYIGTLGIAILLAAIAWNSRTLRFVLFVAGASIVAVLCIVAYTPVSGVLVRPLVRSDANPGENIDAVVVLSGGVTADSAMSSQSVDRLLKGAEFARALNPKALILSREFYHRHGRWVTDSADEANLVSMLGVPAPIYIDSATSTHDEALRVKRLNGAAGWKRIAVVTSPFHSHRACATFERAGFKVTCLPSASRDRAVRNLVTPGDRLRAFQGWAYETAGAIDYRWKGWI